MDATSPTSQPEALALSYLDMRRIIGIIAITLPPALVIGRLLIDGLGLEQTISHYYYTGMRDFMVGSLCAIGVFLLSYKGYERRDDITGDLACLFAVGLAFLPATPLVDPTPLQKHIGLAHSVLAGAFFLTLGYFSFVLFRKGGPNPTPRKRLRNRIYAGCGIAIFLCAAGLGLVYLLPPDSALQVLRPTFVLETVGIWAFGVSWFIKGEGMLRDKETS